MIYLTLEQILQLHVLVLEKDGGSAGVRDIGRLESAVATQFQSVFEVELYASLCEKAAAMARGIIADHPFVDGNKRTAMLCAMTLIEINHHKMTAERGEVEDFAVKIAVDHLSVDEIANWFETHTIKS
ncbi:MAG: type II toxin-antitoxin system death-on-curing family toxin [Candidatus Saccharimonadales bacterium]